MYYEFNDELEVSDYFEFSACAADKEIADSALFADAGTITSTGILLSTLWNQSGIVNIDGNSTVTYNQYCPTDPRTQIQSITGCTNTAAAQLIYYFIEQGTLDFKLVLESGDAYTRSISIKADGTTPGTISFAAINEKLSNFDIMSADDIAALNYACGVVQEASYGSGATSTAWSRNLFLRAGFESAVTANVSSYNTYDIWGANSTISDAGFEILIENLQAGRPVGTSYPGHALIIDGYDAKNDLFHINFGWGNSSATRWYTRAEIREKEYDYFLYDLMTTREFSFTVNDQDEYGTGTFLRAVERASNTEGRNLIDFASNMSGKSVLMHKYASLKGDVLIRNFNAVLNVSSGSYTPYYMMYASGGVLEMSDFSGSLINTVASNGIYGDYCSGAMLDFNGAKLIAGAKSGKTASQLQTILTSAAANNTRIDTSLVPDYNFSCLYLSNSGTDKVNFSNRSISVGSIYLQGGDDYLRVDGKSQVYGCLYFGNGTDTLTVDNSSYIYATTVSGLEKLNFVLNSASSASPVFSVNSGSALSGVAINVDISKASAGTYTLIEAASNTSYLRNLTISLAGISGTLSVNGTSSNSYVSVSSSGNALKLTVKQKGGADVTAPESPFGLYHTVNGSSVTLAWNDTYDNGGVKDYQVRYGKDSTLTSSATVTGTSHTLTIVSSGTYSYQVRAYDSAGNYSDWSAVQVFGSGGELAVLDGKVKLLYGTNVISQGKVLSNQVVNSGHRLNVSSGGTASTITAHSGALLNVYGGKVVSATLNSGATAQISGGTISSATVNSGGNIKITAGATANGLNVKGGRATVNGTATNVQVSDRGYVFASNGGICSSLVVNSGGRAYLRGSTGAVTVSRGGVLIVTEKCTANANITVAGTLKLSSLVYGAVNMNGKTLTLDISGRSSADDFIVDELCMVQNAALVISVAADQASGIYLLGDNASKNTSKATVKIGSNSYSITAGTTLTVGKNSYTLNNRDEKLTLTVNTFGGGSAASVPAYRAGMWSNDWVQASTYAAENNLPIVAVYGDREQCGYCLRMDNELLESPEFNAMSASMVKTYAVRPANKTYDGYPTVCILNPDGTMLSSRSGFGVSSFADYYQWLQIYLGKTSGIYSSSVANSNYSSCSVAGGINYGAKVIAVNTTVSGKSVNSGGSLNIGAGASGVGNAVSSGGSMMVILNGKANSNTVSSGGKMFVSCGGTASNTVVRGTMTVYNGGSANHITVSSGGYIWVSGGRVTDLSVASGGCLGVVLSSGTYISGTCGSAAVNVSDGVMSGNSAGGSRIVSIGCGGKAVDNLFSSGRLYISSGGSAVGNTVEDYCGVYVYSGGAAAGTTVSAGGYIYVYSGGVASNTTISSDGDVYVFSGGHAKGVTVTSSGYLYVSSGGSATGVNWTPCVGRVYVCDGGTISFTSDYSGVYHGSANKLNSSATAMNNSTFSGSMYVMNGGSAYNNTYKRCYVEVGSGGKVNTANVGYYASMTVLQGGVANNITLSSGGKLLVSSGGSAMDVYWMPFSGTVSSAYGATVTFSNDLHGVYYGSGSSLLSNTTSMTSPLISGNYSAYVMSGGVLRSATVGSRGTAFVHKGGTAENTTIASSGCMYVYSGGRANSVKINSSGSVVIDETGLVSGLAIASSGCCQIRRGGVAEQVTNSSGSIRVDSGGVLKNASGCGWVSCYERGIVSNYSQSSGTLSVSSGGSAVDVTISGGLLYVSGGSVANAVINRGGTMSVSSGSKLVNTTIQSGGSGWVYDAKLDKAVVSGTLRVYTDGVVNNVNIGNTGSVYLTDNASATNVSLAGGGYLYVGCGASATIAYSPWSTGNISSGGSGVITRLARDKNVYLGNSVSGVVSKTDSAANMVVTSGLSAIVFSGGKANYITIQSDGFALNYGGYAYARGGAMYGVTIKKGGRAYVSKGSVADTLYISQGGNAYVWSGGTAKNAYTQSFGCLYVYDGGVASSTKLMTNGNMYIYSGGKAFDTVTSYGVRINMYGGSMNNLNMQRGTIVSAYKGAIVTNATVDYGSYLMLGGTANSCTGVASATNTNVLGGGGLTVITGAKATGITLAVNGTLTCNNGATIGGMITNAGRMNLAGSAALASGTNINFNLSGRSASAMKESYKEAMLNSYYVARDANMLITVSTNQSAGSYILANWAGAAKGKFLSLTVGSTKVGYLSIGNSITYNGKKYSLYNFDDATKSKALILTVQKTTASADSLMENPDTLPDLSLPELPETSGASELTAESLCTDSCAPTIAAAPTLDDLFAKTTTQLPLLAV